MFWYAWGPRYAPRAILRGRIWRCFGRYGESSGGEGFEDDTYGTDYIELDDSSPEYSLFSEGGWGIQPLKFYARVQQASRRSRGQLTSKGG